MPLSEIGFLVWLLVLALFDFALMEGWIPGGTITAAIRSHARRHPLLWRLFYVALVLVGFWHFFG
jgi:hypothetical protein